MLRVSYKNRIGYYTKTEKWPDEPERKYRNWICHANCLWADMNFWKAKEDYEHFGSKVKKGDKMAQVIAFWTDPQHLKEALKVGAYCGADYFHFFEDQMSPQMWTAAKYLARAGKTVIIEKSQTKKEKKK